jgi:proline iminopeptidase
MYAHVNGVDLFFDVLGSGFTVTDTELAPKPVVFVHHGGPGNDHSYFRPWIDPLAEVAQLVFIDQRGSGRSGRAPEETYTIEQNADDAEELRKYLGLDKIVFLGHSYGGMVAQVFATRHLDSLSKLILSNTTPSSQFWEEAQEMADKMATPEQLAVLNNLFDGTISSQEEFDAWWATCQPLYYHHPDQKSIDGLGARQKGSFEVASYMMANAIPTYDVRDQLKDFDVPTLVLAAKYDWVTPPTQSAQIREGLPASEFLLFEESGHMPFIEENELYLDTVENFLRS